MTLRHRKIAVRLEKNRNGQHGAWLAVHFNRSWVAMA